MSEGPSALPGQLKTKPLPLASRHTALLPAAAPRPPPTRGTALGRRPRATHRTAIGENAGSMALRTAA